MNNNSNNNANNNSKRTEADLELSIWAEHWYSLKKNKSAMVGLFIILTIVVCAIIAPLIAPHDPLKLNVNHRFKATAFDIMFIDEQDIKKIEAPIFEEEIVVGIEKTQDRDYIKSAYQLDDLGMDYELKETASKDKVLSIIKDSKLDYLFKNNLYLGTDYSGRDILSRIIYGTRISIQVGVISVGIGLGVGLIIGLIAGFYGGWIDKIFMRIIDIMLAFPYILLTIVVVAILGPTLTNAMIAIGITFIPRYARIVRASVLAEKENDYVEAEKALGTSNLELMFKTILPNCLAPIIIQSTLGLGEAILESAALSFLGLGAQPPTPEWGLMIADARGDITSAWWSVTFPGLAILLAVLGFNLLGDGLRDVLDPRLKE